MSNETIAAIVMLAGTSVYVYVIFETIRFARYAWVSRRWGYPDPPLPVENAPSPCWKWAPWIAAGTGSIAFVALQLNGGDPIESLVLSGLSVIGGVYVVAKTISVVRNHRWLSGRLKEGASRKRRAKSSRYPCRI